MSKMFTGNGFPTEEGQKALAPVQQALDSLLVSKDFNQMNEAELRTLQGVLAKMVGDTISWKMQAKRELASKLSNMTDDQFEALLNAKYGDNWMFQSLTPDELDRCPKLQQDKIEQILKESAKHITQFPRNGIRPR